MEKTEWTDEELAAAGEVERFSDLPRGLYAAFVASLTTPEMKRMFKPIAKIFRQIKREEQAAEVLAANVLPRDQVHDAVDQAMGNITAVQIEALIDAAVDKGDIGALRTLAQLGGIDLTPRSVEEVGPGARVISIRPKRLLPLTLDQQDTLRLGIKVSGG